MMKAIGRAAWFLLVIWSLVSLVLPAQSARAAASFHISGRALLDGNGNNFIMRGISHAHVWYPNATSSFANIKAAGVSTIRVVLGSGRWGSDSAADVANVIQLCKTNKLIYAAAWVEATRNAIRVCLKTSMNHWDHVTLYGNGVLVWGAEL